MFDINTVPTLNRCPNELSVQPGSNLDVSEFMLRNLYRKRYCSNWIINVTYILDHADVKKWNEFYYDWLDHGIGYFKVGWASTIPVPDDSLLHFIDYKYRMKEGYYYIDATLEVLPTSFTTYE